MGPLIIFGFFMYIIHGMSLVEYGKNHEPIHGRVPYYLRNIHPFIVYTIASKLIQDIHDPLIRIDQ